MSDDPLHEAEEVARAERDWNEAQRGHIDEPSSPGPERNTVAFLNEQGRKARRLAEENRSAALSGCSLKALGWTLVVAIVAVVVGLVIAARDDGSEDSDDTEAVQPTAPQPTAAPTAPTTAPTATTTPVTTCDLQSGGGAVRSPCPPTTADPAAVTTADPAAVTTIDPATPTTVDVSTFAGRYVMTSGLDDPTGLDNLGTPYEPARVIVHPSTADLVIATDGTITGGSYITSVEVNISCGVGRESVQFVSTTAYDTASGAVTPTGKGTIQWQGTRTDSSCNPAVSQAAGTPIMEFWITGDSLVLCRGLMASPTTCNYPRLTGTFLRQPSA